MIGDHYTDEDEEFKKTIPILICNLEYKCKRCGETFSNISVPLRGFGSEVSMLNDAIARQEINDPYYPDRVYNLISHYCKDSGVGVAEYIGVKAQRTKKEE